ncbi:hypothetical protein P175DRAFT_0512361 [Aspergillus ochraceoroseus IBT 24754]|uniref:Glutamate-1-semialdehyde 2,1-aminomutase n=1 Tax=Aspergillus ochraceoroseus IBT 24754 TaxID=1392256 RepID=A0A2T5LLP0_9EURO|nr:uncharacterized protein P175DRAFT_0512361 [Aspergillus ochraceoroseus IBT 24754]PTU17198.1 hypothetical protein P175DRAFT_0512361 [Aspergillus ochraceoroseus IBT 24754]
MDELAKKAENLLLSAQQQYKTRHSKSRDGRGSKLYDHDGHGYLDLLGDMTAGLYGHSHPVIRDAIISTMDNVGLSLGATTVAEARLAEAICDRFPSIEQLRFCNSGTEANLYALSVARQGTGLSKIIVFEGAYHGGVLYFAHGLAPNNVDKEDWIIRRYNDVDDAKRLIAENKGIAAAGAGRGGGGCIPATAEFLHAVQDAANENGILFILDESLLLHPERGTPITPDLTTLGKWIGGGLAIGAFGGRQELLSIYDPRSSTIQHSGTFNNNTLAMNVGYAAITSVYTADVCVALNQIGDELRHSLEEIAKGTKMAVTGRGSVMNIHFLQSTDAILGDLFWFSLVDRGVWIAPRGMVSLLLGTIQEEIEQFQITRKFLREYEELVKL